MERPVLSNKTAWKMLQSFAIVLHRISHLMRVLHVNISSMQTRVEADKTFKIRLDLAVPRQTPIAMLRDYLTNLCTELGIQGEDGPSVVVPPHRHLSYFSLAVRGVGERGPSGPPELKEKS